MKICGRATAGLATTLAVAITATTLAASTALAVPFELQLCTFTGATFEAPRGVAVEAATRDLFVADQEANRIVKLESQSGGGCEYKAIGMIEGKFELKHATSVLAVDNSSSATSKGDVYIKPGVFSTKLGEFTDEFKPEANPNEYKLVTSFEAPKGEEESRAVAVEAGGSKGLVYIAGGKYVNVYEPTNGNIVPPALSEPQNETGNIIAGMAVRGSFAYILTYASFAGPMRLERWHFTSGHEIEESTRTVLFEEATATPQLTAIALDEAGNAYVDVEESAGKSHVDVFSGVETASGIIAPIEEFGTGQVGASDGIAWSSLNGGTVYVSNPASNDVLVFGRAGLPQISCGATPAAESASVACNIAPKGPSATWRLQYRSITGAGFTEVAKGAVTSEAGIEARIPNLQPAAEYVYRVLVNNGNEAMFDEAFTTLAVAPVASTEAASEIYARSAILNGAVNPENSVTGYSFQYGPCASSNPDSCGGSPYPDSTPDMFLSPSFGGVAISERVEELHPATAYHYRVIALSNAGETVGEEETFTTIAASEGSSSSGTERETGEVPLTVVLPTPTALALPIAPSFIPIPAFPPIKAAKKAQGGGEGKARIRRLRMALRACRHKPKARRMVCVRHARARYGQTKSGHRRSTQYTRNSRPSEERK